MAKGGLSTVIGIAAVGGIGYWLYSSGLLSSLFGTSTTAPTTPSGTTPPAGGTNPVPVKTGPCNPAGLLAPVLAAAQKYDSSKQVGVNLPGTYTIDEWDYFLNNVCSGAAAQFGLTADAMFAGDSARGGPLNWSAFQGYAQGKGLSAANPRNRGRRVGRRMIGTNPVVRIA